MKKRFLTQKIGLIAGACLAISTLPAQANLLFNLSLDTSQLSTLHPGASFAVDFQLNDNNTPSDDNNTIIINNFSFGGGAAAGTPTYYCTSFPFPSGGSCTGVSGNLTTGITLQDKETLNEFFQEFTPGSLLSFNVDLTTNVDAGSTPDRFAFALADVANTFFDVFAVIDIDSPSPSIQTFSISGNGVTLTPIVQSSQTVPEPATGLLLLTGLLTLMGCGLHYSPNSTHCKNSSCLRTLKSSK